PQIFSRVVLYYPSNKELEETMGLSFATQPGPLTHEYILAAFIRSFEI
ncbi:13118_t:CDS:2, partial [Entrophospora sp. SA101]